jgi:hypothetical protein
MSGIQSSQFEYKDDVMFERYEKAKEAAEKFEIL